MSEIPHTPSRAELEAIEEDLRQAGFPNIAKDPVNVSMILHAVFPEVASDDEWADMHTVEGLTRPSVNHEEAA